MSRCLGVLRIIPAYAGSTGVPESEMLRAADHPRIRGEHNPRNCSTVAVNGSSPHTRGAPKLTRWTGRQWRIIPAYAGSTLACRESSREGPDHPRIRGEHVVQDEIPDRDTGSSPHTRGAPELPDRIAHRAGIIPAYAGSTPAGRFSSRRGRDHPRIRGEHLERLLDPGGFGGSSPHTRGAQKLRDTVSGPRGIIPAYAGSTRCARGRRARRPDHPRIRGEHLGVGDAGFDDEGSSPHTRGAPCHHRPRHRRCRIIPAYAGSTGSNQTRPAARPDHPRIRGEHNLLLWARFSDGGSSPHTRGARVPARRGSWLWRIIPAYAGSTWNTMTR